MTITAIRQKLISYLNDADAEKVKALYKLLENDMEEHALFNCRTMDDSRRR